MDDDDWTPRDAMAEASCVLTGLLHIMKLPSVAAHVNAPSDTDQIQTLIAALNKLSGTRPTYDADLEWASEIIFLVDGVSLSEEYAAARSSKGGRIGG